MQRGCQKRQTPITGTIFIGAEGKKVSGAAGATAEVSERPPERNLGRLRFIPIADIRPPKNTLVLKGDLGKLLGKLEQYRLAITIEGDQGAGKTQLAFHLADALAETGRTVVFYSLEIGANSDIIVSNREKHLSPRNIPKVRVTEESTLADVREGAKFFDVVIIDSWTKLDVDSSEFDRLRKDFPDTIFIVLFQRTASNKIRGGTKPLYDAGINIEVVKADNTFVNNYAVATKNRYGQTGLKYNISSKKII